MQPLQELLLGTLNLSDLPKESSGQNFSKEHCLGDAFNIKSVLCSPCLTQQIFEEASLQLQKFLKTVSLEVREHRFVCVMSLNCAEKWKSTACELCV